MTNREIMIGAFEKHIIPKLKDHGFSGKYPEFRRSNVNCIEFIAFQTNKYGGAFTIEVSAAFPNIINKNYQLYGNMTEQNLRIDATNKRYRLPGMFDGWFYYSDVYRKRTLFFGNVYYAPHGKEDIEELIRKGYRPVQIFDSHTADEICKEITRQLEDAYRWLGQFKSRHL